MARTFGDGHRQRFFDIHILAGVTSGDCLDGVPVIGRGDHDGVDIGPIEYAAEVLHPHHIGGNFGHARNTRPEAGETRIHLVILRIQIRCINIAECDDPGIGLGQERLEKLAAAVAHADEAQTDLVVRPEHACRRGHRTRGRRRDCGLREMTSVDA